MRINSTAQLAEIVLSQRKRLKMSQAELAAKTGGVSRQWIVSLEAGRANPDFETLIRLLDAIQLSADIAKGDSAKPSGGQLDLEGVLDRLKK